MKNCSSGLENSVDYLDEPDFQLPTNLRQLEVGISFLIRLSTFIGVLLVDNSQTEAPIESFSHQSIFESV